MLKAHTETITRVLPAEPGDYLFRKTPESKWTIVTVFLWGSDLFAQVSPSGHADIEVSKLLGEWAELPK